ncbi:high-potential iron-sulfur protein [Variovorax sp. Varisp41]|uniref:high-potential iron-sulfur protein n=1 Tax=Variovorax sp. Varisp41 TaxID=3243033 RepID=UPI0039B3EF0E
MLQARCDDIQPPHLHPDPLPDGRCRLRLRCVRAGPAQRERAASRGARLCRRFGQGRYEEIPKHDNAQLCNGCALWQSKPTDPQGNCALFSGKQVNARGWCSAWAKKA